MQFLGLAAVCFVLAGCVGGAGGTGADVETSPDGKAVIETQIGPDGAKVMEFTIRSGATGALREGTLPPEAAAEYERIATQVKRGEIGYYRYVEPKGLATAPAVQPLPDVAGVPQKMTTSTDGKAIKKTYTYGTPPADKAQGGAALSPLQGQRLSGTGCALRMIGGTGYVCASN